MRKGHSRARRRRRDRRHAPGTAPGTLVIDAESASPEIRLLAYGPDGAEETAIDQVGEIAAWRGRQSTLWIQVQGLGNAAVLHALAREFGLHKLALEDVVNQGQRPKVEPYEEYLFLVVQWASEPIATNSDQVSMFLGHDFLLTFEDRPSERFDPIRERIRLGSGVVRSCGPDYLAYALTDTVIDSYFPPLERVGEELDDLEEEILAVVEHDTLHRVHHAKRELVGLRRTLTPHREMLNAWLREAGGRFLGQETAVYLRDCYDHALRATELADTQRELASDLMSTQISRESNRLNEVMKVLTIIATIFIPLSFIAGVYGMNFDRSASPLNMPELGWAWGYPFSLALMGAIAAGLVAYFWRKGWFR